MNQQRSILTLIFQALRGLYASFFFILLCLGKARDSISCGVSPRTWLVQYHFVAVFIISIAHTLLFDFQLQEWTYHYQHILFLFMKLLFYHLSSFSWNGCLDAFYLLVRPSNEMFPFVFNLITVKLFLCLVIFF